MPRNSLFPGFIRLYYQSGGRQHQQIIPCKPFEGVGGVWLIEQKQGGIGTDLETAMNAYATAVKPMLHTTASLLSADLFSMASPTSEPVFVDSVSLNTAGTHAAAAFAYTQATVTYRTTAGGIYRWTILDWSVETANLKITPPFTGVRQTLDTYLRGNTSIVCGRDGGWLLQPIRSLTKTNDALRRKFLVNA